MLYITCSQIEPIKLSYEKCPTDDIHSLKKDIFSKALEIQNEIEKIAKENHIKTSEKKKLIGEIKDILSLTNSINIFPSGPSGRNKVANILQEVQRKLNDLIEQVNQTHRKKEKSQSLCLFR